MEIAAIAGGVVIAFAIAGLAIWLVPRRQVAGWRRAGITDEVKLAELGVQARTSIVQALGGLALIVTLAVTISQVNATRKSAELAQSSADETLRLSERGQLAERFSRAVEQLANGATDVRTGALFSLMEVGLDSPENAGPAFLIAATFVLEHYRPPESLPADGCSARFNVPADVSAALRLVLPALARELRKTRTKPLAGLRGARLDGLALDYVVLQRLDLKRIKFPSASLVEASFLGSVLSDASFKNACLRYASFKNATLDRADFRGADLRNTNFQGASLKRALFSREGLEQAKLTPEQRSVVVIVD